MHTGMKTGMMRGSIEGRNSYAVPPHDILQSYAVGFMFNIITSRTPMESVLIEARGGFVNVPVSSVDIEPMLFPMPDITVAMVVAVTEIPVIGSQIPMTIVSGKT